MSSKKGLSLAVDTLTAGLDRKQLHELYYYILLTRKIEEALLMLYRQGKIVGSLFRSLGQEAVAIASAYALEPGDFVLPVIRDMGAYLARGCSAKDIFTQYLGRKTSPTGGKDGVHHIGDVKRGLIACISMMGTNIPVMTGVALALKLQGKRNVALTYCGDGATSTGDFHEGLNLASVLKVPLILIVENNGWAYSTAVEKQMNIRDIAVRAQSYGIPGYIIDGNDVIEVYRAVKKALAWVKGGNGPVLIEAKTMRMRGHAEHDDFSYAPKGLLEEWKKKDPIDRFVRFLFENKLMADDEKKKIDEKVAREVKEAEEFAVNSPLPDGPDSLKGVFNDDAITNYTPWWRK